MYNAVFFGVSGANSQLISILSLLPALWLDAADSTTITQSNSSVAQWSDKSGNQNHLVQATAANQPTYEDSFVKFTSSRFLAITVRQVFAGTTQGSVFFVGRQPTTTGGGWGNFSNHTSSTTHTPWNNTECYETFLSTGRVNILSVPYPLPLSLVSFENSGGTLTMRRNGINVGSRSVTYQIPLATTTTQRIGGQYGDFNHQEILMFPRVLTQAEREFVEGYLAWKRGLVAGLPSAHPYKNTTPFTFLSITSTATYVPLNINEPTAFTFSITRTGNLTKETTVNYVVTGTGSSPALASEFGGTFPSGSVTFAANETTKTISVTVTIASQVSIKEFTVALSNPVNGELANGSAISRFADKFFAVVLFLKGDLSSLATNTTTTANFTVPAVNSTVAINVVSSAWAATDRAIRIGNGAGNYIITGVPNGTQITIRNCGGVDNAVAGTVINSGATIALSIIDSSSTPRAISSFGNTQISTAQSKYGGSSLLFDGSGDYLTTTALNLVNIDFSVEYWIYRLTTKFGIVISSYTAPNQVNTFHTFTHSDGRIAAYNGVTAGTDVNTPVVSSNTWVHVAITYQHSLAELKIYLNGVLAQTTLGGSIVNQHPTCWIGGAPADNNIGSWWLHAYIDSLRVTRGVIRYTSNFNPETDTYLN